MKKNNYLKFILLFNLLIVNVFIITNVRANEYTVDEFIKTFLNGETYKNMMEQGKKIDPDYNLKMVKNSENGINIIDKNNDVVLHYNYDEKTNSLVSNIKKSNNPNDIEINLGSLLWCSIVVDNVMRMSPYYDEVKDYKFKQEDQNNDNNIIIDYPGFKYSMTDTEIKQSIELSDKYILFVKNKMENEKLNTDGKEEIPNNNKDVVPNDKDDNKHETNPNTGSFIPLSILGISSLSLIIISKLIKKKHFNKI